MTAYTHYLDADGRLRPVDAGAPPDVRARNAVAACPHRGGALPLSEQPYVTEGCDCGELSACAAGKGRRPGKVSMEECVRCVYQSLVENDP